MVSSGCSSAAFRTISWKRAPPVSAATAMVVLRRLGRRFAPWMSKFT